MLISIWCRATVAGGLLGVAVLCASAKANAQRSSDYVHVPSGTGSTVSVATLRIPEKAWKHFAKAKSAFERNRIEESNREAMKAIEIAPDFAAAYLLRAGTEVREHLFDAAIADVKEARRVEPEVVWAGVILAGAYNGLHRYEDARLVLRGLHGAESESWQASYEEARASIGLRDIEGALRWSVIALNSAPREFIDAHLVRTNALLLAHRWTEAQVEIEIYLHSTLPQEHRAAAIAALEMVREKSREETLTIVASR